MLRPYYCCLLCVLLRVHFVSKVAELLMWRNAGVRGRHQAVHRQVQDDSHNSKTTAATMAISAL